MDSSSLSHGKGTGTLIMVTLIIRHDGCISGYILHFMFRKQEKYSQKRLQIFSIMRTKDEECNYRAKKQ